MNENIILDVRHLRKGYKKYPVLRDVSFQIKQGHILGLIGKNGAGKTTLMKSILGLNTNYQGEIIFHGKKMKLSDETLKAEIGVAMGGIGSDAAIEAADVVLMKDDPLALAQAIITKPALLILDEPFVGLDPIGIEDVKKLLRKLCRENGTSIIFSSHQLTEVCDLADDIIILNDGIIAYSNTYMDMKNSGKSFVELMR